MSIAGSLGNGSVLSDKLELLESYNLSVEVRTIINQHPNRKAAMEFPHNDPVKVSQSNRLQIEDSLAPTLPITAVLYRLHIPRSAKWFQDTQHRIGICGRYENEWWTQLFSFEKNILKQLLHLQSQIHGAQSYYSVLPFCDFCSKNPLAKYIHPRQYNI